MAYGDVCVDAGCGDVALVGWSNGPGQRIDWVCMDGFNARLDEMRTRVAELSSRVADTTT